MIRIFAILLLGLVLPLINSCNKSEGTNIDIGEKILKEMAEEQIPSVAACIVKDDKIVWEGNYGYADIGFSTPVTGRSLYTIMSISKLVLSVSVMQLWEDGLIDLDKDINEYLPFDVRNPNFPDRKITLYMLLNHSSGLAWPVDEDRIPDFHHFYSDEEPPLLVDWIPEYILPEGSQYRTVVWKDFPPGEKWLYSNIGTSLLALIVEQISGMDYRDYCKENIVDPLEMDDSGFRITTLDEQLLVTPYDNNNYPMNYYTSRHYPVGFLSSSTHDFSHFVIAMLNHGEYKGTRILQSNTVTKMLEIQNPESGVSFLWWHCIGDCVGHLGGGTGFSTWTEWQFDAGRGIIIFSNKVNESIAPGGRIYELIKYKATEY